LIIGFVLSELIHEFIPAKLVERYLAGKTLILYLTIISILALSFGYIFYLI